VSLIIRATAILVPAILLGCYGGSNQPHQLYRGYTPSYQSKQQTQQLAKPSPSFVDSYDQYKIEPKEFVTYGKLFNSLSSGFRQKDEFETSGEYKARCDSMESPLYIVKMDLANGARKVYFKYDTDKQIATIKTRIDSTGNFTSIEVSDIEKGFKNKGSYLGSNAFGVTKNVKVVDINSDLFVVLYDQYKNGGLEFAVKADKHEAQNLLQNFGIAIKFHVKCHPQLNGVAVVDKQYSGPTIDGPVAGTFYRKRIPIWIESIVIYDEKTNESVLTRNFSGK
jgi:hypothetical protein